MARFYVVLVTLLFYAANIAAQNTISGMVTDGFEPLKGTTITIKGTNRGTTTDADGRYSIQASPRDIIVYSHVGMITAEVMLEDVTKVVNIELTLKIEELDEAVVTKYKRKTQTDLARSYYSDKSTIHCYFGYLNPDIVGYHLRVIDGKSLNHKAIDILDAIAEKLPGVTIRIKEGNRLLFTSSYGSLRNGSPVAYSIDGRVFKDSPVWLDLEKIIRVAIIPGGQAIQRYGNIARGGIVVINTNSIIHSSKEDGNRPYDMAKLRNNIYANDALGPAEALQNGPNYLRELYSSEDGAAAFSVYQKYVGNFGSSYSFVVDTYRCLLERFGERKLSQHILDVHRTLFKEDPLAMKALAYVQQANGNYRDANDLYKDIFIERPGYVQSYLDLAASYREMGENKKAAQMYSRFGHLVDRGYFAVDDTTMIAKMVEKDFSNLLAMEGGDILSNGQRRKLETADAEFGGTRLVFEWNDGEAEFELQFVNPEGRYFKTEHSLFADGDAIRHQKLLGYTTEEFLVDDSFPGNWQVNVKYLGNKRLGPSYLKAVIYHDYGTPQQRKETKVFRMGIKNVNVELFKVNVPAFITD